MLRRTLQCFVGQEIFFTPKRAIMAKGRAHANAGGDCGSNKMQRTAVNIDIPNNCVAGDMRNTAAADGQPLLTAPQQLCAAASSLNGTQKGQQKQPVGQHEDASPDAYRFLLNHIDSEIAALKQRITTVAKRREGVENNQTRRIRELFECIERPWLLLESTQAPQLPNKALDVYAKEVHIGRCSAGAANFEHDAVFLDACRRNWRGMTTAQRKPYEIAARRNEHVRRELKRSMASGCPHFESFCEQVVEWTAEMTRAELREKSTGGPQTRPRRNSTTTAPRGNTKPGRGGGVCDDGGAAASEVGGGSRCVGKGASRGRAAGVADKSARKQKAVVPQRQPKQKLNRVNRANRVSSVPNRNNERKKKKKATK